MQNLVGNLESVKQAFQYAIELKDNDPSFIYYAAQIALAQGDDTMRQHLEKLADQDRSSIVIDPDRVPQELRSIIPLAMKWGIGDDTSRRYFVERATSKEKRTLRIALEPLADFANAWLNAIADDEFSDEAIASLYLLEAAAELRD